VARLSAHEFPIAKIFSSDFQYSIPDYQRPYSWRKEQALELVSDLRDALLRDSEEEPYFLGSIVLVKPEGDPAADVIDGQQRLTTLTILLAVLRDLSTSMGVRSSLEKLIREEGDEVQRLQERPRLDLRPRDRDFFRDYVQGGLIEDLLALPDGALRNDAQRNIQENTQAIRTELANWDEEERAELTRLLINRTYLVTVTTPDLASAHRIFNVMNARGLDLSAADVFKARVIGDLEDEDADAYAVKWEDSEEDLGRASFQDLFLHIRVIFAKIRGQREILQEFPTQVLNQFLPGRASEFVDQVLLPYGRALSIVDKANYSWPSGAEQVNQWLRRLSLVDNADWKPPALWLVRKYEQDPATLAEHLGALERVAAVMLLRRTYATPRATRYANLVRSLESGLGLESPEFQVSEEERRGAILQLRGPIYEVGSIRKFVLLRLDDALSAGGAHYTHPIITVEHVLPQNPAAGSMWLSDFKEAERGYWVHRLGNLVLLDRRKNSEAQNYDFETKRDRYFKSDTGAPPFVLTSAVIGESHWTPRVVQERQERLVAVLAKHWNIDRADDGTDLTKIPEVDLVLLPAEGAVVPQGRGISLAQLVESGRIPEGTVLSWPRPRLDEEYQVEVLADGRLKAEDGRVFDTPSGAAVTLSGATSYDGWDAWRMPDGTRIGEIWRSLQD
jgi:hypothetical protein